MYRYTRISITALTLAIATIAHSAETHPEPFLELKVSVPLALKTIERIVPAEAKADEQFQAQLSSIRELKLNNAYLFLYPDAKLGALPILLVTSQDPAALPALVAANGLLGGYLQKVTGSSYKLSPTLLESEGTSDLPLAEYRLWVSKKTLLFAPRALVASWSKGAPKPMATRVAKTAGALQSKHHALVCAVQIADDIGKKDWDKVADELPIPGGGESAVLTTVGSDLLGEMSEAFSSIESFAFGFQLAENNQRVIEYAQQFRAAADIAALFKQITKGSATGDEPTSLIAALASVMQSDNVTMTPMLSGNNMSLKLAWAQEADETVVQSIGGYLMGKFMSAAMGGMGMSMSSSGNDGPLETRYTTEPDLQPGITAAQIKQSLQADIREKLFRGHYFEHGDTPKMTMALDPLAIPNVSLTKVTYRATSVTSADGTSVMRPDDRDLEKWGPREIRLSHSRESQLEFPIQKGTKGEQLDKGVFHIDVTAPTGLVVLEFTKEQAGTKQRAGAISVRLNSIRQNSVSISYSGGKRAEIIAFDATGGCLASRSSSRSSGSQSRRFDGLVERIKVAVSADMTTFGLDVPCDLKGGAKEELADEPTNAVRTRYDNRPPKRYADYSEADIADLQVEWKEAGERGRQDKLFTTLPKAPFSGSAAWEVHFLGANGGIVLGGDSQTSTSELSYTMKKGSLASAHAATGALRIKANAAIQTLSFTKKAEEAPLKQSLPSGRTVTVTFNKNSVTLAKGESNILDSRAYDRTGRMLKADWRSHRDIKTYWGVPVRFEVDGADRLIERTIPFTITQRPVEAAALKTFQDRVAQLSDAALALKALQSATQRIVSAESDDTVAGFYYLYDRRGNPRATPLIPEAIAHSDPGGAKRYGYTVKPYNGYCFSRLKGIINKDGTTEDNRTTAKAASTYKWKGGEFPFKPYSRVAGFVATPIDKTMPTIVTYGRTPYICYKNGEKIEYIPKSLRNTEWKQFHVLD